MRAQTQLDFAIGMGVFLVVTAFVLSFVPGMLQPFESSNQEETVAANRVADQLVGGMLGSVDEPYVLDRACTAAFFESREDGNDPGGDDVENVNGDGIYESPFGTPSCNFADDSLKPRLGLDGSSLSVRVRIVRDLTVGELDSPDEDGNDDFDGDTNDDVVDTLCVDDNSGNRLIEANDPFDGGTECDITGGDDDVAFILGEEPSDGGSVVVARRTVSITSGLGDGTSDATLIVEVW